MEISAQDTIDPKKRVSLGREEKTGREGHYGAAKLVKVVCKPRGSEKTLLAESGFLGVRRMHRTLDACHVVFEGLGWGMMR